MRSLLTLLLVTHIVVALIPMNSFTAYPPPRWIIDSLSFRSSAGGDVYPGSRGAVLEVTLRYVDAVEAHYPLACLITPIGFNVREKCSPLMNFTQEPLRTVSFGEIGYVNYVIDVARDVEPGDYVFTLNIRFIHNQELVEENVTITVTVNDYPRLNINIIEAYFTPHGYPGSQPVNLVVKVLNNGSTDITGLDLEVEFADNISPRSSRVSVTATIQPGQYVNVVFNNLAIDPNAQPGVYEAYLSVTAALRTNDNVFYSDNISLVFNYTIEETPAVKLRILDYRLTSAVVLPGLRNTGFEIVVQSLEPGIVDVYGVYVSLRNGFFTNGSTSRVDATNVQLSYGDSAVFTVSGVNLGDEYWFEAAVTFLMRLSRDNSLYLANYTARLLIPFKPRNLDVKVLEVSWINGRGYRGSTGNSLIVVVVNNEPSGIRDAYVTLSLPNVFEPRRLVYTNVVLNPYSVVELTFSDITISDEASIGTYGCSLEINGYLFNADGSTVFLNLAFKVEVEVKDHQYIEDLIPKLTIESTYWGEYSPTYVYPGNARAPLTIVIRNDGLYNVYNLLLKLTPLNEDINVLNPVSQCNGVLNPGGICQTVFYLNLSTTRGGVKKFVVNASFNVFDLGLDTILSRTLVFEIVLPELGFKNGVMIVNNGWLNNYPVYPNSRGAVYTLTFVNYDLYSVQGVWIDLELPRGFKLHNNASSTLTYFAGPVPSFQTFTINYMLDVEDVEPGLYSSFVKLRYVIQQYGSAREYSTMSEIYFTINNPVDSIKVVKHYWYGEAPLKPTQGSRYVVIVWNKEFPVMQNPILKVLYSEGLFDPLTGSNVSYYTPTQVLSPTQIQIPLSELIGYFRELPQEIPETRVTVNKGDYVVFALNIGLTNNTRLSYGEVLLEAIFIDHWGYVYSVKIAEKIRIVTRPPILIVEPVTPLVYFINGSSFIDISIKNPGGGVVYEIYSILTPVTAVAIPQGNVKFVESIKPNETVTLRFTLIYNPLSIAGFKEVTYSSIVFTLTLMYRDELGYIKVVNQTLASIPVPFIEVSLTPEVQAKLVGGELIVNGVVVNTGLSKARSLVVTVEYGGKVNNYIIGDLEPSSQIPFRVTLENVVGGGGTCTITLTYLDEFNTRYTKQYHVNATAGALEKPTVEVGGGRGENVFYIAVVVTIALFLLGVFVMLSKYVSGKMHKLR